MNYPYHKAALLGAGLLAAACQAPAQTADRKTAIGLHANATQYRGDLGNNFWDFKNMPYSGGLDITRYVGKVLDLKLDLDYTRLRSPNTDGSFNSSGQRFSAQTYSAGLGFKLKAPIKDSFFLHPYLLVEPGFSWVLTDRYASPTSGNSFTRYGTFTGQVGRALTSTWASRPSCSCKPARPICKPTTAASTEWTIAPLPFGIRRTAT